jgi:hypothetical protein
MRIKLIVIAILLLAPIGMAQTTTRSDNWNPLSSLVGIWEGTGSGQPGVSKVQREYRFVMNDKFIHVQNKSTYDPQPKNPKGEVHQDLGHDELRQSQREIRSQTIPRRRLCELVCDDEFQL